MDKKLCKLLISLCLMISVEVANALEFKDVPVAGKVIIGGEKNELKLNGVGMRTKFFFDIYVGALYLKRAENTSEGVLSQNAPKRLAMHFVYDEVPAEKLVAGWNEGFESNLSDEQLVSLAEQINTFNAMFETVRAGDEILLDYLPEQLTRVTIKGEVKGLIEGKGFNDALLNIWLGDEPADEDLKEAMLNTGD